MNIKSTFFTFIVLSVFAFSCSKDDNILTTQNDVKLDGQPFEITTATILGVSLDGSGHASVSLGTTSGSRYEALSIDVEYSGDSSVEGTYSFPQAANDKYLDDFLTNYSISEGTSYTLTQLTRGNVTIKKNTASNFTITLDLTMDDGSHFTGTYRGVFIVSFNNG